MKKFPYSLLFYTLNAALLVSFAPSLMAQTTWTGATDNNWNTATNWTNGVPSDSNQPVTIAADGANVTMSAAGASRSLTVSGDGTTAPILNITQNLSNNFSPVNVGSSTTNGSNFSGTINHTSGTVTIGGGSGSRRLHIAASAGVTPSFSGNNGTYNFGGILATAPILSVTEGINIGGRSGETGTLSLSGHGTISNAAAVQMSQLNGNSTLNVTGGNLSINFATGISAGTVGFSMANSGAGLAKINATINATGFSTINIGGDLSFGGNGLTRTQFNLALDNFAPTVGSTFTILSATGNFVGTQGRFGNVANDDILTVGGIDFRANYNTGIGNDTFVLTVIPEPSTWALLALPLIALVIIRRCRAA